MGRPLWITFNLAMVVWTLAWLSWLSNETYQGYYEIMREHREVGPFQKVPKHLRHELLPPPTETYTPTGSFMGIETGVRTTMWTYTWGGGTFGYVDRLNRVPPEVPYGVLGVSVVVWLTALAKRYGLFHRVRAGCCKTCGYDLRATPGSCPECGAGRQSIR